MKGSNKRYMGTYRGYIGIHKGYVCACGKKASNCPMVFQKRRAPISTAKHLNPDYG